MDRTRPNNPRNRVCCIALLFILVLLSACSAGKAGGTTIAFLRNRSLWTIQPDGTTILHLTAPTALGFAWSPDHHQLAVRFAATSMFALPHESLLGTSDDTHSGIGIISIDGGNILPITPIKDNPIRSDIWWNANGNRILYREQAGSSPQQWIQSQVDQPGGIARKIISNTSSIPTTSADGSQIASITDAQTLVIGQPAQTVQTLRKDALSLLPSGYPARPLWQPQHDAILYASSGADAQSTTLQLTDLQGKSKTVSNVVGLQQYCWSPNGDMLLLRTAQGYTIHSLAGGKDISWDDASVSIPWWSPNSHYVATQSATALTLVTLSTGSMKVLATLHDPAVSQVAADASLLFHPVAGNIWNTDSSGFALVTTSGTWFNGTNLVTKPMVNAEASGLYIVTLQPITKPPALVDWGEHQSLSWSTANPNTQFVTPYYISQP